MKRTLFVMLVLAVASVAQGTMLEEYDGYSTGKLGTVAMPPWFPINFSGTGASLVERESTGNNLYGKAWYAGGARGGSLPLGAMSILNSSSASTLFMRARVETTTFDGSFGLSDSAAASNLSWGNFEVQMAFIGTTFRVRNAGIVEDTGYVVTAGTWYNIWAVVNNVTDRFDVYITNGVEPTAPVATGMVFRNSGGGAQANDLITFLFLNNSQAIHIDDIHISSGSNLSNPAIMQPKGVNPVYSQTGVLPTVTALEWTGGLDPNAITQRDPSILKYYVYMNASATDPNIVYKGEAAASGTSPAGSYPVTLEYDRSYRWQIEQGIDDGTGNAYPAGHANNVKGSIWKFSMALSVPSNFVGPANTKVNEHATAVLTTSYTSVSAVTSAVWHRNGSPVDTGDPNVSVVFNDTSSTLTLTDVTMSDEGAYHCVVTNAGGPASSPTANVALRKLLAWYQFEQNMNDSSGNGNDATVVNGMAYVGGVAGIAGQSYAADPNGGNYGLLTVNAYPKAGFGNGLEEGTVSFWMKAVSGQVGCVMAVYNDGYKTAIKFEVQSDGRLHPQLRDEETSQLQPVSKVVTDGEWHYVVMTYTPSAGTLYVDVTDQHSASDNMNNYAAWQYAPALCANNSRGTMQNYFSGVVDDLQVYNYAQTEEDVAQAYYDVTGKVSCINPEVTGAVDFNGDCVVDLLDVSAFLSGWLADGLYP